MGNSLSAEKPSEENISPKFEFTNRFSTSATTVVGPRLWQRH
jgi:hypothetical protein